MLEDLVELNLAFEEFFVDLEEFDDKEVVAGLNDDATAGYDDCYNLTLLIFSFYCVSIHHFYYQVDPYGS